MDPIKGRLFGRLMPVHTLWSVSIPWYFFLSLHLAVQIRCLFFFFFTSLILTSGLKISTCFLFFCCIMQRKTNLQTPHIIYIEEMNLTLELKYLLLPVYIYYLILKVLSHFVRIYVFLWLINSFSSILVSQCHIMQSVWICKWCVVLILIYISD